MDRPIARRQQDERRPVEGEDKAMAFIETWRSVVHSRDGYKQAAEDALAKLTTAEDTNRRLSDSLDETQHRLRQAEAERDIARDSSAALLQALDGAAAMIDRALQQYRDAGRKEDSGRARGLGDLLTGHRNGRQSNVDRMAGTHQAEERQEPELDEHAVAELSRGIADEAQRSVRRRT